MAATAPKTRSSSTRPATRDEWNARAEQLAVERGTRGTAQSLGPAGDVGSLWRVPSRSSVEAYDVVARRDGVIVCPCGAGRYGRPCAHAGAVVHGERQRLSEGEASMAWDWWMSGGEW